MLSPIEQKKRRLERRGLPTDHLAEAEAIAVRAVLPPDPILADPTLADKRPPAAAPPTATALPSPATAPQDRQVARRSRLAKTQPVEPSPCRFRSAEPVGRISCCGSKPPVYECQNPEKAAESGGYCTLHAESFKRPDVRRADGTVFAMPHRKIPACIACELLRQGWEPVEPQALPAEPAEPTAAERLPGEDPSPADPTPAPLPILPRAAAAEVAGRRAICGACPVAADCPMTAEMLEMDLTRCPDGRWGHSNRPTVGIQPLADPPKADQLPPDQPPPSWPLATQYVQRVRDAQFAALDRLLARGSFGRSPAMNGGGRNGGNGYAAAVPAK